MFMNTTKEEFAERLKKLHVESPFVKKTWEIFDSMRAHQKIGDKKRYPRHLFLIGHSGIGKSHLINKYMDANAGYTQTYEDGTEIDIKPVIVMEMPNPFTVMEFYQSMVRALGAPTLMGKKTIGDVKRQAFTLIEQQKVEMIILDEMNYIVKGRSMRGDEAMEHIKHVANSAHVSLVCVGTPVIDSLRTSDFQYLRRYPVMRLDRYKECDETFIEFMREMERNLQPPEPIGLGDPDSYLPQLFHNWSKGVIGLVVQILIEAYRLAGLFDLTVEQCPILKIEDLEAAKNNVYGDLIEDELETLLVEKAASSK